MSALRRYSNPLGIRYFSAVPYLLGARAVKYSLTPRDAGETKVPKDPSENYLREAMVKQLRSLEQDGKYYSDKMDNTMWTCLRMKEHPKISYHLTALVFTGITNAPKAMQFKFESIGELVIAGVTNEITMLGPAYCAAAVPVMTKIPAPMTAPMVVQSRTSRTNLPVAPKDSLTVLPVSFSNVLAAR
jgi:hypothetical protein